jgi:hypothetical protein
LKEEEEQRKTEERKITLVQDREREKEKEEGLMEFCVRALRVSFQWSSGASCRYYTVKIPNPPPVAAAAAAAVVNTRDSSVPELGELVHKLRNVSTPTDKKVFFLLFHALIPSWPHFNIYLFYAPNNKGPLGILPAIV